MKAWTALITGSLLACADAPLPDAPVPRATFVAPADGDTVPSELRVRLAGEGVRLAPAHADAEEGTGHLLLFVNAELAPIDRQIPLDDDEIIHLADGASEVTLTGLAPGEHRLIAALAGSAHRRIVGARADTIHVIVLSPR